jgi:predicted DNA-binding protein with PD1-like motif
MVTRDGWDTDQLAAEVLNPADSVPAGAPGGCSPARERRLEQARPRRCACHRERPDLLLPAERREPMHVIEVRNGELLSTIQQSAREQGITNAAIVTLIGAVDSFTLSTMSAGDATKDVITDYELPAEMTATGEIVNGVPHIHAVMAVEGGRAISGHLHRAHLGTWFARAYLLAHILPGY